VPDLPPWRYRRILIYASWLLGAVCIAAGIRAYQSNATVAAQLVVTGGALIGGILSVYIVGATWQDINLWKPEDDHDELP
jgi:hypothetical protein